MTASGAPADGSSPGRILIVDDQEPNRLLLSEILETRGYQILQAEDGEGALALARSSAPDLILLDVSMPGMSGLEVCRALREDARTASLPIILVTALAHREHRLEGIAAGASDYLTKPVDRSELLLRVRNAVQLNRLHVQLAEQYQSLHRLEQLRDSLVHMIVHDLRSPLTGIKMLVDAMREELGPASPPTLADDLTTMDRQVRRVADMVTNVLDVSRFEAAAMPLERKLIDLVALAEGTVASLGLTVQPATVRLEVSEEPVPILADGDVIGRVIGNLVGNAVKFAGGKEPVRVEVGAADGGGRVRVIDSGPGIAPEHQGRIFEKFAQVDGPKLASRSSGLGLTFCKLAVEAHGGRIGIESEVGKGCAFWFTLPSSS